METEMGRKKHKYPVRLSQDERSALRRLTSVGSTKVRKYKRAQILLLADENDSSGGKIDQEIIERVGVSRSTVVRIRRQFVSEGLESALNEKPRPGRPSGISGAERAQITALACSSPPEGYSRWSLRLLANKAVELEFVETISHNAVGKILKKTS